MLKRNFHMGVGNDTHKQLLTLSNYTLEKFQMGCYHTSEKLFIFVSLYKGFSK